MYVFCTLDLTLILHLIYSNTSRLVYYLNSVPSHSSTFCCINDLYNSLIRCYLLRLEKEQYLRGTVTLNNNGESNIYVYYKPVA